MLWLIWIKNVDKYMVEYCLNVGLLVIVFGWYLGVGCKYMELLGLCGMLYDVGKMKVDQIILNKLGKLIKEEYEYIKLYVNFGWEILQQDMILFEEVIVVCYYYYEW